MESLRYMSYLGSHSVLAVDVPQPEEHPEPALDGGTSIGISTFTATFLLRSINVTSSFGCIARGLSSSRWRCWGSSRCHRRHRVVQHTQQGEPRWVPHCVHFQYAHCDTRCPFR